MKAAVKAGVSEKTAASMAMKFVSKGAGSAVEGALYGLGGAIDEHALGKADFNAESLASHMSFGAAIGGGIGAFTQAAETALPYLQKLKNKVGDKVSSFGNAQTAAKDLVGFKPNEAFNWEQKYPTLAEALPTWLKDRASLATTNSSADLLKNVSAVKEGAGQSIGEIYDILSQKGAQINKREFFDDIATKLEQEFITPKIINKAGDISPSLQKELKPIQDLIDSYRQVSAGTDVLEHFTASDLHALRKDIDGMLAKQYKSLNFNTLQDAQKSIRHALSEKIESVADNIGTTFPEQAGLAKQLKDANFDYRMSNEILPKLERKVEAGQHAHWAGVKSAALDLALDSIGLTSNNFQKLAVLGVIEKQVQKVNHALDKTASIITSIGNVSEKLVYNGIQKSELASTKSRKDEQAAYEAVKQNVQEFAQNPQKYTAKVEQSLKQASQIAPNTIAEYQATHLRQLNHLSQALPKRGGDAGIFDGMKPHVPSSMEMARFNRVLQATEKPETVLKDLQQGRATREQIDTLKKVYPQMYHELRIRTMQRLQKHGASLPYNKRVQIGLLLDMPTDSSLLPRNILSLQANFQGHDQPKQSPSRSDKLNIASRSETESTKISNT